MNKQTQLVAEVLHIICLYRIETFIYCKIDATSSNALEAKKEKSRDMPGQNPNSAPTRGRCTMVEGMQV